MNFIFLIPKLKTIFILKQKRNFIAFYRYMPPLQQSGLSVYTRFITLSQKEGNVYGAC